MGLPPMLVPRLVGRQVAARPVKRKAINDSRRSLDTLKWEGSGL